MRGRYIKAVLAIAFLGAVAFQACSRPGNMRGTNVESSGPAAEIPIVADLPNSGTVNDGDVLLTPVDLQGLTDELSVQPPPDCEQTCEKQMGCEKISNATEKASCVASCSVESGLCQPYPIANDPNVITKFTVPAGYKVAHVTLKHCTDRQDVLHIEGTGMHFKTLNPAMLHVGSGWSNMRFLGANVGRGPDCEEAKLRDVIDLTVQTYDDAGEPSAIQNYKWKMPAVLGYTFSMIKDIDPIAPTFVQFKSIEGPGVKILRIYDNDQSNKQLSFLVEYLYWYDPVYKTSFDFYYKKQQYQ